MTAFAVAGRDPLRRLSTEMNITPLVDVMLVLLVIFMLAVPLPSRRIVLENPPACVGCPAPGAPVRLAIKRTGELYWDGAAVSRAALVGKFAAVAKDPRDRAVELHVEGQARYSFVTDVLAVAQNAGVERIGIAPTRD